LEQNDFKPPDRDEVFHELPRADPFFDFAWRVRLDVRMAIGIPLNRVNATSLPSSKVDVGWSKYDNIVPDPQASYQTDIIENNQHPIWNR